MSKSIDSILESATRLESEIQKETLYWEEILGLHDKGWSVSKIPRRKDVMGVRLGSSEGMLIQIMRQLGPLVNSTNSIFRPQIPRSSNLDTRRKWICQAQHNSYNR